MRNLFDQYNAPENRLTHALGCCLQRDGRLLRAFVRWVTGRRHLAWRQLEVLEQQVPGLPMSASDDDECGLPDLWIHGDEDWSLIVESKVMAKVSADQLRRHKRTAERNGFTNIDLVVLAPAIPPHRVKNVLYFTWPQVYCWLRRQAKYSQWAACMSDYMEIAETRMSNDGYLGDESLTEFDGIPFGTEHPYTYREAKRVIRLALEELRRRRDLRKLGMDPEGEGRPAITGRDGSAVWDFIPLRAAKGNPSFTSCPHLTLGIQSMRTIVVVTLPNAVPATMRGQLIDLGIDGFANLIQQMEKGISKALRGISRAYPYLEAVQRHFPSQRSSGIEDARLEFDLRTAVKSSKSPVKQQVQWMEAVFAALSSKRSNLQLAVGAVLPYIDPRLHSRGVLDVIAGIWIGCKPWIKTILDN